MFRLKSAYVLHLMDINTSLYVMLYTFITLNINFPR